MGKQHRLAVWIALAGAGAWLLLAALTVLSARLPASRGGEVLVLFPPALRDGEARARIFQAGGVPLGRVVTSLWHAYSNASGFVGRLDAQGALLVLPELRGAGAYSLCGSGMELLAGRAAPGGSGAAAEPVAPAIAPRAERPPAERAGRPRSAAGCGYRGAARCATRASDSRSQSPSSESHP